VLARERSPLRRTGSDRFRGSVCLSLFSVRDPRRDRHFDRRSIAASSVDLSRCFSGKRGRLFRQEGPSWAALTGTPHEKSSPRGTPGRGRQPAPVLED